MDIADLAAKAALKFTSSNGRKLQKKMSTPAIPKADPVYIKNDKNDGFSCGFAMAEVMPADITAKKYWMAGYKMGNLVTGVYDPTTVRAMWLDCKGNEGILLVSCDIIGLTGHDVNEIRASLSDFCRESGCKYIDISCTHTHAGIDTVGYWGKLPRTGLDKAYMAKLFASIKDVCIKAYNDRKPGKLYMGYIHVPDAVKDGRAPYVVNDKLSRLRFVPDDGSNETWFMNYSAHPNTMGGANSKISADYPYFMREKINESKKVNVLFAVGAIAATNIADLDDDRYVRTKKGGEMLGEAALKIDNDVELDSSISFISQRYYAPIDNCILALMPILKVCTADKFPYPGCNVGIALRTEMTYMKIGSQKILIFPGELFCELVYGGYASAEDSATGLGPEINPEPLARICGDDSLMVFGVSNDMTGYVVAPNDSVLHPTQAYLSSVHDRFDRNHYHETNSLGKDICFTVERVFRDLVERLK